MSNEEKIKEITDLLSGELDVLENAISDKNNALAICSREEIFKLIYRLNEAVRQQTLEEAMFKLNKLPMYLIRKEIGVTAPDVMITSNMPISVVGLCKDDVFSNLQALKDKNK